MQLDVPATGMMGLQMQTVLAWAAALLMVVHLVVLHVLTLIIVKIRKVTIATILMPLGHHAQD